MSINRDYLVSALLGAIGTGIGYTLGTGIENTWQGILIGIFLGIMAVGLLFSWISFFPIQRAQAIFLSVIWGITAEFAGLQSELLVMFFGMAVGIAADYAIQNLEPQLLELRDKYLPVLLLILGLILTGSILAGLIWAYPRGLLIDVAKLSLIVIIPAMIIVSLAVAGWIAGWIQSRSLKPGQILQSRKIYREGGLYANRLKDEGGYNIIKILKIDEFGYHIRIYSNLFQTIPTELEAENLYFVGLDKRKITEGFGMGHVPILKDNFEKWTLFLIQQDQVKPEELEGYLLWKTSQGGYFGKLAE
jgi:hypothetical protein